MKLTCEKYLLQSAVAVSTRAAASKSPIPTLEGILLEAGEDLRVTGYDLKKGIYTNIEAEVSEPGSVVLDAKLFGEMVRKMPDGIVSIVTDSQNMTTVKCGKSEFSFMGMDSGEYPELPSVDGLKTYTRNQGVLKSMINQSIFAVSDNDARPVYTGSMFEVENGILTLVSVDGYRLALRREAIEGPAEHNEFIVPGAALSDLERISAPDSEETVRISVGGNHVSFTVGKTVIVSRRLEGDFLNYKKALPEVFKLQIKVNRSEILRATDRVVLIVDEKTKNPVRMTFNEGFIDFRCTTPIGKAEDVCFCEGNGEGMEIGFNGKYLMDALKAAPADELIVCLNTSSSPCVILPADGSDKFKFMILPIRLRA